MALFSIIKWPYFRLTKIAGQVALAPVLYHGLSNVAVELLSVEGARRVELVAEAAITLVVVVAAWRLMRTHRQPLGSRGTPRRTNTQTTHHTVD